jgi:hypothetical protein
MLVLLGGVLGFITHLGGVLAHFGGILHTLDTVLLGK